MEWTHLPCYQEDFSKFAVADFMPEGIVQPDLPRVGSRTFGVTCMLARTKHNLVQQHESESVILPIDELHHFSEG